MNLSPSICPSGYLESVRSDFILNEESWHHFLATSQQAKQHKDHLTLSFPMVLVEVKDE